MLVALGRPSLTPESIVDGLRLSLLENYAQ